MRNLREAYRFVNRKIGPERIRSLSERVTPEGITFSGAAGYVSGVLLPVQAGFAITMRETGNTIDPNLAKFLVIAGLGIINAISIAAETKSLERENYSADIFTNALHIATGKPLASSLSSHALGYGRQTVLNPVSAAVFITDRDLLLNSALSGVFVYSAWSILMNSLILTGATRPFVETVAKTRRAVGKKFKKMV